MRGEHEELVEPLAAALGRRDPELAAEVGLDRGDGGDRRQLRRRRRPHVGVEAGDEDPSVLVAHRVDEVGEAHAGLGTQLP